MSETLGKVNSFKKHVSSTFECRVMGEDHSFNKYMNHYYVLGTVLRKQVK